MNLNNIGKSVLWAFKRHPLLYYVRFGLICKNHKGSFSSLPTFNQINSTDDIPEIFMRINQKIPVAAGADPHDKAISIAVFLRSNIKGGTGLGLSSDKSLEKMLAGKGGVCSDFSQVFNLFCLLHNIKVREWGMVEKFYNPQHGHTFNEVYSEKTKKWLVIDVKNNLIFVDRTNNPLSAEALFTNLRHGEPLNYQLLSEYKPKDEPKLKLVFSARSIPFVIANYNNAVYDKYLNKYQNRWPVFMINALMIVLGKNYNFVFPFDNYRDKLIA